MITKIEAFNPKFFLTSTVNFTGLVFLSLRGENILKKLVLFL